MKRESKGDCGPAGDRPAATMAKKIGVRIFFFFFLNRIDVLDSGRMINEGERGVPMFDGKRLKYKSELWHGEKEVEDERETMKRTKRETDQFCV